MNLVVQVTNTHVAKASVSAFFYLPALVLPAVKRYKGYLAPLAWIAVLVEHT